MSQVRQPTNSVVRVNLWAAGTAYITENGQLRLVSGMNLTVVPYMELTPIGIQLPKKE